MDNLDIYVDRILNFSIISFEKMWSLSVLILKGLFYLSLIILSLTILWSIVFLLLNKFNPVLAIKQREITTKLLKENLIDSEIYEAGENLVMSIYGAISSLVNTLALVISLAFTSIAVLIAFPFRFLQTSLDTMNLKLFEMRIKQQKVITKRKALIQKSKKARNKQLEISSKYEDKPSGISSVPDEDKSPLEEIDTVEPLLSKDNSMENELHAFDILNEQFGKVETKIKETVSL